MKKVKLMDLEFDLYITKQKIVEHTERIARQIQYDYNQKPNVPLFLVTLTGASVWGMQLFQEMKCDVDLGFVKCSSYGKNITSCGYVTLDIPPTLDVEGRDVIVVEDVVDSGCTWEYLYDYLTQQGAASVRIAAMTLKPKAYKKTLPVHYVALEVENLFIVGNGLDYNQQGRNLKDIYKLCK